MKQLVFVLAFLTFIPCISQDYNEIKNNKVVFIHFENLKTVQKKTVNVNPDNSIYDNYFYAANGNLDTIYPIRFAFFGKVDSKKPRPKYYMYFRAHKNFIKKNKNIIITRKFMKKIGLEKTKKLFNKAKIIFLIEKDEKYKRKVIIKQVLFDDIINI